MRWRVCIFFVIFTSFTLYSAEYLYPVYVNDSTAFLIYQKNPYHIELWEYDRGSKQAMQLLLSRCTPAGFQILPDQRGFSFIDNGVIKIKSFLKRSARSLELDAPIYQLELLHWIDERHFYASGRYQDIFGIFQIDYDGTVLPLCLSDEIDSMYPQKIDNILFYIERDSQWGYSVCKVPYSPIDGDSFKDRVTHYYDQNVVAQKIISFDENPITFLKMVSQTEGFLVGHPPAVSRADREIPFDYYRIRLDADDWHVEKIFSFIIKGELLLLGSPLRLYESLLPLLPRHDGSTIIYTSAIGPISYLYQYDLESGISRRLNDTEHLFPPIAQLAGGIIDDSIVAVRMGDVGVQMDLAHV